MDKNKTLKRLAKAVKHGKFAWERYVMGGTWHGLEIQSQALYCSYGQIGYTVTVNGSIEIRHDWEMDETEIITYKREWDGEKFVEVTDTETV